MTWEELKEEAKKMGYSLNTERAWPFLCTMLTDDTTVIFYKTGTVVYQLDGEKSYACIVIAEYRTPDQMLAIMKALQ